MTHGSIIGYDINAKMCQISYYNEKHRNQRRWIPELKREQSDSSGDELL